MTPGLRAQQESDYTTKINSSFQQAATLYPTITIDDSPLSTAFVSEVHRLQNENPAFFRDSDWPLMLISKTAARLSIFPATAVEATTAEVVSERDLREAEYALAMAQHEADWDHNFINVPLERVKRADENQKAAKEKLLRLQQQYDIQQAPVRAAREQTEADAQAQRQAAEMDHRRSEEIQAESDAQTARKRARHAEEQIQELESQVDKVRSAARYEYNKAAIERGNQATYGIKEAADRKIQELDGKINDARNQKSHWENTARQAEQQ